MRSLDHRNPGPIPAFLAATARGEVVVELIGDGTHPTPDLAQSTFAMVGGANVALVTDARGTSEVAARRH